MSELRIYAERSPNIPQVVLPDLAGIQKQLATIGVGFERWAATQALDAQTPQDEVIDAYRADIDRLMKRHDFKSVDVIGMYPTHPQKDAFREKFLAEHTHDEYEVRFFVDGAALFYLHAQGRVFAMLCERDDLLSVPAGMTHWFDMGPAPSFKAIRLFTSPEGWVARYTGNDIAQHFPRYEAPAYTPVAAT
ncbi:MAG: cupin [Nevskiaceae bacterium]|nr:MAG: cupin [Nevskiaceae bacterium]TBR72617.1 MAG: cupin [Nevskiaceae bacterium]